MSKNFLLSTLVAAAALGFATVPAVMAATDYNGTTYIGEIYSAKGTGNFSTNIRLLTTWQDGAAVLDTTETTNAWSAKFRDDSNTIRFGSEVTAGTVSFDYNWPRFSGLIVESDGWTLSASRKDAQLGAPDSTGNVFTIGGNFTFIYNTFSINGAHSWSVAAEKTFTLGGTGTLTGNVTVSGGGTVAVSNTLSGTGTLNLNSATLSGGTFSGATIAAAGANATISGTTINGATIDISTNSLASSGNVALTTGTVNVGSGNKIVGAEGSTIAIGSNFVFNLIGATSGSAVTVIESTGTVEGWTSLTNSNFKVDGLALGTRDSVDVSTSGQVTITVNALNLTWNGTSGGTWSVGGDSNSWLNGEATSDFQDADSVTFGATDENQTISVTGTVAPNAMTVAAGEGKTYTFDGSGTISATTLSVNSGTMSVQSGLNVAGTTSVASGATLDFSSASAQSFGTVISGAGKVSATGTGTLTLSAANTYSGGTFIGSAATIAVGNSNAFGTGAITGSGKITATSMFASKTGLNAAGTSETDGWRGTVSFSGDINNLDLRSYGNAQSSVELNGVTGYFLGSTVTFDTNLVLSGNGITMTNGYSDPVYTFTGSVSGSGNWTFNKSNVAQKYVFTGDVSGYSGTISINALLSTDNTTRRTALTFGNGGEGVTGDKSVSGTGTITMERGSLNFNYSNDVMSASTITGGMTLVKQGAGALTLTKANTYTGGTTVSAGTLVAGNNSAFGTGAVSVASGAKLQIASGVKLAVSGVTLAEGAKLVVDLSGKTSETETFVLELISSSAISVAGTTLSSSGDITGTMSDRYELIGWNKNGWTESWSYLDNKLSLTLTAAIPEPSLFGVLAGLGALALVGTRRRRK